LKKRIDNNIILDFQLSAQDIQRLLESGALADPLQIAQLQRLQQEALVRNDELARAALLSKSEIKLEEEKEMVEYICILVVLTVT